MSGLEEHFAFAVRVNENPANANMSFHPLDAFHLHKGVDGIHYGWSGYHPPPRILRKLPEDLQSKIRNKEEYY